MVRSTSSQKSQRLNAAFKLITNGYSTNHSAVALVRQFHISLRQAYRYLQKAQSMEKPVPVAEPIIPITIKIPNNIAVRLRAYAHTNGLTIGEVVSRAMTVFFVDNERRHG